MFSTFWTSLALLLALTGQAVASSPACKCGPHDPCWPSAATWKSLNASVSGQLIRNVPAPIVCYPGPQQNATQCAYVDTQWSNATFQSDTPIGLSYPIDVPCPPVNISAGQTPGTCSIGSLPRYAVNATTVLDVAAAVDFANKNNVRLVIKDTGHDLLGRSTGFGSLEVWLRYLRTGVEFQQTFKSSSGCKKTNWTGSAFTIGGGYTWKDVYPMARSRNVIVVGGGTPSVGCLGGWMQGGGHGPASRNYGLGADQVLEATVVLANGSIVTASPCQHPDLFFAIRGGGGGTYGVVVSTTIKAYPNTNAAVQHLAIASLSTNTTSLFDAIETVWSAFPDLNDAGYAGYGSWAVDFPTPLFSNVTTGYVHGIYMFGQNLTQAQSAFASTQQKLQYLNGSSLFVSVSYVAYDNYWDFYFNESGVESAVGTPAAIGSRLFDRASLTQNATGLKSMLHTIAGTPGQFTSSDFELVSGGQVFKDASDPWSGVNPAWRTSYMDNLVSRGWLPGASAATIAAVEKDITNNKIHAMKAQAPNTGAYMNEADRNDPTYAQDFYGHHLTRLSAIKKDIDPSGVFYCPTCIGSWLWTVESNGSLCKA